MIAFGPLMFVHDITWAHRMQAAVLLLWLAVGVYCCISVVHFNSFAFENARHLTIIETVYFLAQVITTVGYGDIVPAFAGGQMFVGVYVFITILIVADSVTELIHIGAHHMKQLAKYIFSGEAAERFRRSKIDT